MKLTLQAKLVVTGEEKALLLQTMEKFNAAASFAAKVAFEAKVFSQPAVHKRCYADIRAKYGLSAQLTVRAIGKAVETFKRDKKVCPAFKPHSAVIYDERILSFKGPDRVSIYAIAGRLLLPCIFSKYHQERRGHIKGQSDLVYRKESGQFFLYVTIDLPDGSPIKPEDAIGVDLGVVRLAADSDGRSYTGDAIEARRKRFSALRSGLQSCGSRSAKRHLKRMGRDEAFFRRDVNHCISKSIVASAKGTRRAIALEDLKGIRERTTVRRNQRARRNGWAFSQLRLFIEYKAKLAGVTVVVVDAHNTSRTCPECGHCEKGNRKSQSEFVCRHCGYSNNADYVGALNIRAKGREELFAWAAVNRPFVSAHGLQAVG